MLVKHPIITQHQKIWWQPFKSAYFPFIWDIGYTTPT